MPTDLPSAHVEQLDALASWYWWHVHRIALTLQLFSRFAGQSQGYIDIGCGPGSTTRLIADGLLRRGLLDSEGDIAGVDGDIRAGQRCAERGISVFHINIQSRRLYVGGPYGLFTALDVLEHLESPELVLRSITPSLYRDSIGIVSVPAFPALFSDWDRSFGHFRRYTVASLRSELETSGYQVLWCGYAFAFAFPMAWIVRKMMARREGVEFPAVPAWINAALRFLGWLERA